MALNEKFYIVINPNAGTGKGKKLWEKKVSPQLEKAGVDFDFVFTEAPKHAIDLTQNAIRNGYRKIIAMGGDGTHHEVANGILLQNEVPSEEVTLFSLPVGTGNDWIKTMKIPSSLDKAIELINNGNLYLHDIGRASYFDGDEKAQRYFLNVAGAGFDAFVAQELGEGKKNQITYLWQTLKSLIKYENPTVTIDTKGRKKELSMVTINIGNCKYFGGGMKICPEAVPNDGLFDITLIKSVGKFKLASKLSKLYDGSFVKLPFVETFRTSSIDVESKDQVYLQLDGELLGHGPFKFDMLPKALKVNAGPNIDQ